MREMHYVAGFLIDPDTRTIVLVRKGKPEWQAGRLNGVGGRIEPGESDWDAMRREFREETGQDVDNWERYATVDGLWGSVQFFRAFGPTDQVRTMESEPIEVHAIDALPYDEALPNLSWLIPLALYRHHRYMPIRATETESGLDEEPVVDELHVRPVDDLIEHTFDDDCPCGPVTEAVFRHDGSNGWLHIHHSLDGREAHDGDEG